MHNFDAAQQDPSTSKCLESQYGRVWTAARREPQLKFAGAMLTSIVFGFIAARVSADRRTRLTSDLSCRTGRCVLGRNRVFSLVASAADVKRACLDGRSRSSSCSPFLQSVCRGHAKRFISSRLRPKQRELVSRQTSACGICRIVVCRLVCRIGMATCDKSRERGRSSRSSPLDCRSRRRWKGVGPVFRGVFAPQRPAMLRYARKRSGQCVEPPSESRPSSCGRGCLRLAVRSLCSRKSVRAD
ncbi:hypothetical protein R75465_08051 [Paraburkholderia aspalathi]|nr:hypothetical protein R75465_08051 [Paraburkholderia aspalathi]